MQKRLLLLFVFVLSTSYTLSQWKLSGGPTGGEVLSLLFSNDKVFAGTQSGLFSSVDTGKTWSWINTGVFTKINFIKEDQNKNIFIGTNGEGISWSSNGGASWTSIKSSQNLYLNNDAVFNGTEIFVTGVGGIEYSAEGAANWQIRNQGLTNLTGQTLDHFTLGSENHLLLGTQDGIFHSSDWAVNWTEKSSGLTNKDVRKIIHYTDNNNLTFVSGTFGGGVFVSTDTAKSWAQMNNQLTNLNILTLFRLSTDIYAGTVGGGVYKAPINTFLWNALNTNITSLTINAFLNVGLNLILATNGGIYTSLLNPINWAVANIGITNAFVYSLSFLNNVLYAGTLKGLFASTDLGAVWTKLNLNVVYISAILISPTFMLASSVFDGTFKSTDGGNNWTLVNGLPSSEISSFTPVSGGPVFASTKGNGVYKSTDNGQNWTASNSGLTDLSLNNLFYDQSLNKLLGSTSSGLYESSDTGKTWVKNSGLGNYDIKQVKSFKNSLLAINNSNVYKSTDNGINWSTFNNGLPAIFTNNKMLVLRNNNGDVRTSLFTDNGVYTTTDVNSSWVVLDNTWPSGLKVTDAELIFGITIPFTQNTNSINSTAPFLFVSTNGVSVWRRQMDDVITEVELVNNNIPDNFYLFQNYPNPFNPSTTISYSIPAVGMGYIASVKLIVYDILGREVATLVNKEQKAGNYKVTFNSSNLTSGIYLYRIVAGDFVQTKKMILMK